MQLPTRPTDHVRAWERQTALTAVLLLAITISLWRIGTATHSFFPLYQVQSQDALPLVVLSIALLVAAFWTPDWRLPARLLRASTLALAGLLAAALLAYGSYALMGGFPLSIDERMVVFDMAVFDRMRLATPLAAEWRPFIKALEPGPLLNEKMPTGLVSAYLPMNAVLRLAFSKLADPALFNPLLALAGGAALLDIARRTFKNDVATCGVVLLIYALSAQMLVNAMTVYSMTGHMALNIIWLAAFLRGGRLGHSVAILTGFVATGLHQLVFHPFFVAPFLLWRLRQRDWRVVLLYGAAYSAIVLWWVSYPVLAAQDVAGAVQGSTNTSFAARIAEAFAQRGGGGGHTGLNTFFNLLRFFAWQNVALLPLLSASVAVALRNRGLPAVMLLGIGLWLAFIAVLIPFQGHGWGYRYLHPYLGSFALLTGYGYQELRALIGRRADSLVLTLSGVTVLATIPMLFTAAHGFIQPYLAVERLVSAQRQPMVLIDTYPRPGDARTGNAIENVRNLPDLSNRPLRISSRDINSELLSRLCGFGKIALVGSADQHRVGFPMNGYNESFPKLVETVKKKMPHCFVPAELPTAQKQLLDNGARS